MSLESVLTTFDPLYLLCLIPLLLLTGLVVFDAYRERKKYQRFLRELEGTEFFCYTNRKNGEQFVKEEILPKLDPNMQVIHLRGRKAVSELEEKYISQALYNVKQVGFPNVMKVVRGKMLDVSLHNDFYNVINQGKTADDFLAILNERVTELRNK